MILLIYFLVIGFYYSHIFFFLSLLSFSCLYANEKRKDGYCPHRLKSVQSIHIFCFTLIGITMATYDVIILAGGKGSRMEDERPKVMVPVGKITILGYQLSYLKSFSFIDRIIISINNDQASIIDWVNTYYPHMNIHFSVEHTKLGTAGGLRFALEKSTADYCFVLNGDNLADVDLLELSKKEDHVICVRKVHLNYGVVLEQKGYAVFKEKPLFDEWVNSGWYLFKRESLMSHLPEIGSLEYDVFPKLKMRVYYHDGFCKSLNTKKDIEMLEQEGFPKQYIEILGVIL